MGLEMNLYKRKKNAIKTKDGYDENDYSLIGDWYKANQIHAWFVENCVYIETNDCYIFEYEVTKSDLEQLIDTCKSVLSNHRLACTLLPPSSDGEFFGSTTIDDDYFIQLQETIDIANQALNTDLNEYIIIYYAYC